MNKKMLKSKYLFERVKEFTYTYDIPMHHAVGSDADLKEHILDVFRNKMVKDLITTLQESDEVIVPVLSELIQTEDPRRMCFCLEQHLEFYKCILNVNEDIFKVPEPVASFSIGGKFSDIVVADEYHDIEKPKICGVDDGAPKEKPYIFGGNK